MVAFMFEIPLFRLTPWEKNGYFIVNSTLYEDQPFISIYKQATSLQWEL